METPEIPDEGYTEQALVFVAYLAFVCIIVKSRMFQPQNVTTLEHNNKKTISDMVIVDVVVH